jgi:glycosyltransferase involved in cell wall biosynthesis
MNQVRIHGDPFGEDAAASLLRSFVRLSLGSGLRCSLSVSAVRARRPCQDEREIELTDGERTVPTGSRLPPAEIDMVLRAAGESLAATAPVVVFAPACSRADAATLAGLEWPAAATIVIARDEATPADLLERVRAELRWAGGESPRHSLEERELAPWLSLPLASSDGPILHVGAGDWACGADLAVDVWLNEHAVTGRPLRIVLADAEDSVVASMQQRLSEARGEVELVRGVFEPRHARDASAIVLPWRRPRAARTLVQALASGRPVVASRFAGNSAVLGRAGICMPVGGSYAAAEGVVPEHFAPHPRALSAALRKALGDGAAASAVGVRARRHVVEELTAGRPSAPPPAVPALAPHRRPVVVLEAPIFESSPCAESSIEIAQALVRRGRVDVRIVPRPPFRNDLAALRRRAASLEALLCRDPGRADVWLSLGRPVRVSRPPCRTWALHVDGDFGSLPLEMLPHVTDDADIVLVPGGHARDVVIAAGRAPARVLLVPHGLCDAIRRPASPDPELLAWKGGRPAVLFCGELDWLDGFDVFLRALLGARQAGLDLCAVVAPFGSERPDARFELGELLRRYVETPGTPPLRLLEPDLSRPALASVYSSCDLLLHPHRNAGSFRAVLEAGASGLPVLATAGGDADSLLGEGGSVAIPSSRRELELPTAHVSAPWVLEPSASDAGRLLIEALSDLEARRRTAAAAAAAPELLEAFSWDVAAVVIERLAVEPQESEPLVALPAVQAREAVGSSR